MAKLLKISPHVLAFGEINALTDSRVAELEKTLGDKVESVTAEFIHFVEIDGKLTAAEENKLDNLLTYGEEFSGQRDGKLFLVTPRIGTISPWSSKATDIAHASGLTQIKRIERGIAYYVKLEETLSSDAQDLSSRGRLFGRQKAERSFPVATGETSVPSEERFKQERANLRTAIASKLHDRMTESVLDSLDAAGQLFAIKQPQKLGIIDLTKDKNAIQDANKSLGLAMADDEIDYLVKAYKELNRNPTDVELMMFAQVNSEHCRHKIFNADWIVDGEKQPKSLFQMIRNTYEKNSDGILSAYSDNAAVLTGEKGGWFFADPTSGEYSYRDEPIHSVIKAETHNHPTAIAPNPGAATGSGGEIRDEGATGRGAKPKMGLSGFTVSNLNLPDLPQPWEKSIGKPDRIASPMEIMLKAPIGGANYVNEFGRPNLTGYFRTFEQEVPQSGHPRTCSEDLTPDSIKDSRNECENDARNNSETYGYHKPLMIAGGLGNIRDQFVQKNRLKPGNQVIVLGGPNMRIGLGGGAASSMQTGTNTGDLDFASVQRANAEMERRCQQVIDTCWALGENNPIISIHDVGAGGMSNALPELVHDSGLGAIFQLRDLPSADASLSPAEIWCNESQERYVLGISADDLPRFERICQRERCPYAVVGITTEEEHLTVKDELFKNNPVDLPMETLFGKPPKMTRKFDRAEKNLPELDLTKIKVEEAAERVLQLPAVASKKFLITIGDRSVGGLVTRDQMVGPHQIPVADVAVTAAAFDSDHGEAMTMGERTPLAVIDAPASARIAIGEAITNILSADIAKLSDIKLSANWMAAAGYKNEDQALYDAVRAVGEEFCPDLGMTIPVGKDSLSMRTVWTEEDSSVKTSKTNEDEPNQTSLGKARLAPNRQTVAAEAKREGNGLDEGMFGLASNEKSSQKEDSSAAHQNDNAVNKTDPRNKSEDDTVREIKDGKQKSVTSPLSLIISAFAPVANVAKTLTPELHLPTIESGEKTELILIDLGKGKNRLGGSALAQTYNQIGNVAPDIDVETLKKFFAAIAELKKSDKILAYHDRSDGGFFATLTEMAFASRCGLQIDLTDLPGNNLEKLFNEELGAVVQVKAEDAAEILKSLNKELGNCVYNIGHPVCREADPSQKIAFYDKGKIVYENSRENLEKLWAATSYQIQRLRDNADCADAEFAAISDESQKLTPKVTFEIENWVDETAQTSLGKARLVPNRQTVAAEAKREGNGLDEGTFGLSSTSSSIDPRNKSEDDHVIKREDDKTARPQVAIFREQGINGQIEMAAAFDRAGFATIDVHLNDLKNGKVKLDDFVGLAVCGGFSYGDVLGAGAGWAKTILFDPKLRADFEKFFARDDTFSLGVCNGCQMLSELKELIPGAESWPKFRRNKSDQFEARLVQVRVNDSPSIFLRDMADSVLPIVVAHGEGRAEFPSPNEAKEALQGNLAPLQYVDTKHQPTEIYPANPNGSPDGITSLTSTDGRATIMMPHPERVFQTRQLSWHPDDWGDDSPWMQMFLNARKWVDEK